MGLRWATGESEHLSGLQLRSGAWPPAAAAVPGGAKSKPKRALGPGSAQTIAATPAWVGVQGPRAELGRRRGGVRCLVRSSRIFWFRLVARGLGSLQWDPRSLSGRSERRVPCAPGGGGPCAPSAARPHPWRSGEDALGGRFSKHPSGATGKRVRVFLANLQLSARLVAVYAGCPFPTT